MLNKESRQDQDDFACGGSMHLRMRKWGEGATVAPHKVAVSTENGDPVGFRLHAKNFNCLVCAHWGLETCYAMRLWRGERGAGGGAASNLERLWRMCRESQRRL
jgi:hypothetical protein